jgi:hypothetical protein
LLEMCNQPWSEICDLLGLYAAQNGNSYHQCSAWHHRRLKISM